MKAISGRQLIGFTCHFEKKAEVSGLKFVYRRTGEREKERESGRVYNAKSKYIHKTCIYTNTLAHIKAMNRAGNWYNSNEQSCQLVTVFGKKEDRNSRS